MLRPAAATDGIRPVSTVRFDTVSKHAYIDRLRRVFARNEYVNINFEETAFTKAGVGGELYGIRVQQDYYSATYGDRGYLFLIVDLNSPDKPVIHVRVWQPSKDAAFGPDGLVDLTDF